jgi:hypothetical protein
VCRCPGARRFQNREGAAAAEFGKVLKQHPAEMLERMIQKLGGEERGIIRWYPVSSVY